MNNIGAAIPDMEDIVMRALERHENENKEKTVVISNATTAGTKRLSSVINLSTSIKTNIRVSPPGISFDAFSWGTNTEGQGTTRAVNHLFVQLKKFNIPLFSASESEAVDYKTGGYDLLNVSSENTLLSIETDKFKISGGTDAVIVPSGMRDDKEQQLCCVFEFKTKIPGATANVPSQLVVEAISAQMNSKQPVLSILTDLCSNHAFGVFFQMDATDMKVTKIPILFQSLAAMAHYVSQFLATNCEPRVVGLNNRSGGNADSGGGGASGGGSSGGDDEDSGDEGGDRRDGSGGGDSKRARVMMVENMNQQGRGDISLAHEHFNDHIDDTEPLSEERATMVNHLFQSYGYTIPSYQFGIKSC